VALFYPSVLFPAKESILLMNKIEGFFSLAIQNKVLTFHLLFISNYYFPLSPTYFEIKSLLDILKKDPYTSVAHALAK
jgi:hypothetical protein